VGAAVDLVAATTAMYAVGGGGGGGGSGIGRNVKLGVSVVVGNGIELYNVQPT